MQLRVRDNAKQRERKRGREGGRERERERGRERERETQTDRQTETEQNNQTSHLLTKVMVLVSQHFNLSLQIHNQLFSGVLETTKD